MADLIMATNRTPEQKIILCGEFGAGKSSMFRRFTNNSFLSTNDRSSTLGLDHFSKVYNVDERDIKVSKCVFTFIFVIIAFFIHKFKRKPN